MKLLHLAVLLTALAATPAFADKDLLGRDIPEKKHAKQDAPALLPGLSGNVKASTDPQNSEEGDAAATKKAPPAADAAMFEQQGKSAGGKPPPVEKPAEDAPKKKPEGQ